MVSGSMTQRPSCCQIHLDFMFYICGRFSALNPLHTDEHSLFRKGRLFHNPDVLFLFHPPFQWTALYFHGCWIHSPSAASCVSSAPRAPAPVAPHSHRVVCSRPLTHLTACFRPAVPQLSLPGVEPQPGGPSGGGAAVLLRDGHAAPGQLQRPGGPAPRDPRRGRRPGATDR